MSKQLYNTGTPVIEKKKPRFSGVVKDSKTGRPISMDDRKKFDEKNPYSRTSRRDILQEFERGLQNQKKAIVEDKKLQKALEKELKKQNAKIKKKTSILNRIKRAFSSKKKKN